MKKGYLSKLSKAISILTAVVMITSCLISSFAFNGTVTAEDEASEFEVRTRTAVLPTLDGPLNEATDVILKNDDDMDTFINPVSISYQFQETYNSREAADPAAVLFTDKFGDEHYYLFASHNSGYWWSDDLAKWNYVYALDSDNLIPPHRGTTNDFRRFAPATMVIGDYLYITHSEGGSIFKSNNPKDPDSWEFVRDAVNGWGDPALLYDEELDRTFCYYGTSGTLPLYVVELDHNDNMKLLKGPISLYNSNREAHGYEVNGDNNDQFSSNPFLEGAWATKYNGKYYLEFGVPGTQFGSYADGVLIADDPLGPFKHCDHGPVSYKGTGYVRGAGHGCTFRDKYGNWWKVDTVSISTTTGFERRLILFPATHTEGGELISNTMQADYPMYKHDLVDFSFETPGPDWQLLSYNAAATASSTLTAADKATYPASSNKPAGTKDPQTNAPSSAFDENLKTWWSAATGTGGEWLEADLGAVKAVNAFQVNFADQNVITQGTITGTNGRLNEYVHKYLLEFSIDGDNWYTLVDKSDAAASEKKAEDYTHQYFELEKTIGARYIRITNTGAVPMSEAGGKFAISGLRFFGYGQKETPAEVQDFTAVRPVSDERSVNLSWDSVPGAEGYVIRMGIRPDIMHNHYKVIGGNQATIRILNRGVDYYFSIDSYNDSGYTKGTVIKHTPYTLPAPAPVSFLRSTLNNLHSPTALENTFAPEDIGYNGIFFEDFETGSYLLSLGLKKFDIITGLNDMEITDVYQFLQAYETIPDGQEVVLKTWHKNRYIDVTFTKNPANANPSIPCVIQATAFDGKHGSVNVGGSQNIGGISSGDWVVYEQINFVQTPDYVVFRASKDSNNFNFQMRLDSPDGPVIAELTAPSTGNWNTYQDFKVEIIGDISNEPHDIYLTFPANANIQWFSFNIEETELYPSYEVARFSDFEQAYTGSLYADWKTLNGKIPVDLTQEIHDPDKLYLRLKVNFASTNTSLDLSDAFTTGQLKLRSPDVKSKPGDTTPPNSDGSPNSEHNFGWDIKANWGLKIGDNIINIPLKDALEDIYTSNANVIYGVNNKRGVMDWTAVERIIMRIDSATASKYPGVTFTMTIKSAQILNITFEEEQALIQGIIDDVIPSEGYTESSYNAYMAARVLAQLEIDAADSIAELIGYKEKLQRAIDGLQREGTGPEPFLPGDPTGDGNINIFDIMLIRDHIFGKTTLEDEAALAADVNNDDEINIFDIMMIRDHIFGKISLTE